MTSRATRRGRKRKIYPDDEIYSIVERCLRERSIIGRIKYSDVYKFSLELFDNKEIGYKLSEDFWRKPNRQGTLMIEKFNEILEETVAIDETESETVISTEDAVHKILLNATETEKENVIDLLRLNEVKAKQYMRKNKGLNDKIRKLEKELAGEKEKAYAWRKKVDHLETILFQIMEHSSYEDFPINNLITTGVSRSPIVQQLFQTMFSANPTIAYDFELYCNQKSENVIKIEEKVYQRKASDDFKF